MNVGETELIQIGKVYDPENHFTFLNVDVGMSGNEAFISYDSVKKRITIEPTLVD